MKKKPVGCNFHSDNDVRDDVDPLLEVQDPAFYREGIGMHHDRWTYQVNIQGAYVGK
jgi:hypothetical protein